MPKICVGAQMLNICWISEILPGSVGNRDLVYMWEKQKKIQVSKNYYQNYHIRSRLMKGSGAEESQGKKRHLLPEQKDLGAQCLEAFQWEPQVILSSTFTIVHYVTSGRGLLINWSWHFLPPWKGPKDFSNTIENEYFFFGTGHYQQICVQNVGVKYF